MVVPSTVVASEPEPDATVTVITAVGSAVAELRVAATPVAAIERGTAVCAAGPAPMMCSLPPEMYDVASQSRVLPVLEQKKHLITKEIYHLE